MNCITKVVISVGCNSMFSIELAFHLLRRKAFADSKLDLYLLTSDTDSVKEMAEHIKLFGFSNLNELVVTENCHTAFVNADYLLLTSSSSSTRAAAGETVEYFEKLAHVFKKAELFDRWANPNARVLVMGPQSNTWLQIFAEVAKTNLSAHNFTGLSRHYVSKASELIARKLDCEVHELSNVYVWGEHYLDITCAKKKMASAPAICSLLGGRTEQSVIELLPSGWVDELHASHPQSVQTKTNSQCVISAVCHHIIDWCRGTGDRKVCMATIVQRPGHISDRIYSSYPVVIDRTGHVSVVYNTETEPAIFVKLYRFYENQQKEINFIRNFLKAASKTTNDN